MARIHFNVKIAIFTVCCCSILGKTWADTNTENSNKTLPAANVPETKSSSNSNGASVLSSTIASNVLSTVAAAAGVLPHTNTLKAGNSKTNTTNCVCDGALLPRIGDNGVELEICPDCKCKHVSRNTTLIKVVVILVIWIISILVIYMLFLMCLDPLLNKRVKANYQEHTNEDDDTASAAQFPTPPNQEINARANVLNRVGHQQDKWKRQVREQRRHIYDRRTMLN